MHNALHPIVSVLNSYFFTFSSPEGEKLKNLQHTLKLQSDGSVFLIFPTTVCHVIDEASPLYNLTQKQLKEKK